MKTKLFFIVFLTPFLTSAATVLCAQDLVNRPDLDATAAIQRCIDNAKMGEKNSIEFVAGNYRLSSAIKIHGKKDLTFRTAGRHLGIACLSAGALPCAVFKADSRLRQGPLLQSVNSERLRLEGIALDGNIKERRQVLGNTWGREGFNATIHECLDCSFHSFSSVNTVFGTALEYIGDRALFENSLFADNGLGLNLYPAGLAWADGLTILSSDGLRIRNCVFWNNSDINLIIGNAPNSIIENNHIENTWNFAFAGFMIDNFNNSRKGDFTNAIIQNNTIEGGPSALFGIGIDVGPLFWYKSNFVTGGTIQNNKISNARQGILVAGAKGTQILNNTIINRANYKLNSKKCVTSDIDVIAEEGIRIVSDSKSITNRGMAGCGPTDLPKMTK